ncbi:outer membrane lipoprotein carrier protein LolA [Puteibacter caeruleilacunae]|nr:outer membrane lipoprotein carrier protein LolA [Puteibacter caeruleilacunae]
MRKGLILLFVSLFMTSVGMAQQDAKAKEILDKVSAKTEGYKSIQAEFTFSLVNEEEDMNDTYEGKIKIKDLKYKLDLMGAETYFNGEIVATYLADANEVNIAYPDEEMEEMLDPSKLFSIYENGFKYKMAEGVTKADVFVIDLFPEDESKNYSRIRIDIDKSNYQIKRAEMDSNDGNKYVIVVKSMKTEEDLPDTVFNFDKSKHEGVIENDMR